MIAKSPIKAALYIDWPNSDFWTNKKYTAGITVLISPMNGHHLNGTGSFTNSSSALQWLQRIQYAVPCKKYAEQIFIETIPWQWGHSLAFSSMLFLVVWVIVYYFNSFNADSSTLLSKSIRYVILSGLRISLFIVFSWIIDGKSIGICRIYYLQGFNLNIR